ncbi:ArnT family glycosyltransferase [Luteolibacter marinus]|uniref:ArnT family glycosyltransferase n=1 Tax=Luteolibacter marinus TaxID=2776705 RepID=UPI0018666773|nr:phospholipid carrier-dependent glycosyltransferase [Luteolibacter marinus]
MNASGTAPTSAPLCRGRVPATWLLGFLVVCRVLLMVLAPHTDPTEARYAEMARKMVETGDWITPQFDYGTPFWSSPPLGLWFSALGIDLFGANEFGSRIFIFAAALAVLWLVAGTARRELGTGMDRLAAALLLGMPLFFYCSAAVMNELILTLGITLAMVSFRVAFQTGSRGHGYAVFAGLAIGLLAKGPLALALALPPLAAWLAVTGHWRRAWRSVPWLSGSLLMLAATVPWYVVAERKTPGFLAYFLRVESWGRYLPSGWTWDPYGNGHDVMPGLVWLYAGLGSFPWCLMLLRRSRPQPARALHDDARGLYWLLWAVWPLCLFTPLNNVIASTPLPALPPLALLLAGRFRSRHPADSGRVPTLHPGPTVACAAVVVGALVVSVFFPSVAPKQSERGLVRRYEKEREDGDHLVYYGSRRSSAEFYSEGSVDHTTSPAELAEKLAAPGRLFVAMPDKLLKFVPPPVRRRLELVQSWGPMSALYAERPEVPGMTRIDPSLSAPIGN